MDKQYNIENVNSSSSLENNMGFITNVLNLQSGRKFKSYLDMYGNRENYAKFFTVFVGDIEHDISVSELIELLEDKSDSFRNNVCLSLLMDFKEIELASKVKSAINSLKILETRNIFQEFDTEEELSKYLNIIVAYTEVEYIANELYLRPLFRDILMSYAIITGRNDLCIKLRLVEKTIIEKEKSFGKRYSLDSNNGD